MGLATYTYNRSTSGGEIITHLINATDGEGLHFDGAAGYVDIASPPDLGTKFSLEFIVQADSVSGSYDTMFVDFGTGGRFAFGINHADDEISIYDSVSWKAFGVLVIDDLKPHHLVATIDGTAAILYDNGNQVGTATISAGHNIDLCTDAKIGSRFGGAYNFFDGTIYRARFWNKTLTAPEVTASYENATVPFADQYGSQTIVIPGDFTGDLDGWDASNTWNSQTNPSNNMVLSASASGQYCRTNTTLEVGKKYRLTYTASGTTSAFFGGAWAGGYTNIHEIIDGTRTVDFTFEFAAGFTDNYFYCHSGASTSAVTLSNLSLVEIGCVADYDLAFANPTQSTMVQDRSTNGVDGTSSATGVVQVTPIEQLNSKSARIGTTAATPADGDLLVSGNVGVGGTPSDYHTMADDLVIAGAGDTGMTIASGDASDGRIFFADGTTGSAESEGQVRYDHDDNSMHFHTADADRLTIHSDGELFCGATDQGVTLSGGTTGAGTVTGINAARSAYKKLVLNALDHDIKTSGTSRLTISTAGLATFSNGIAVTTGGVAFPATQSASADANTLDDYEEGNGVLVVTMTTSGSVTLAGTQKYWYTKVGNICHFSFEFQTTAISTPVGSLQMAIPFTSADYAYSAGAVRIYSETFTGSPFVAVAPGTTVCYLRTSVSGSGTGEITPTAGTRYYFGEITYRTA